MKKLFILVFLILVLPFQAVAQTPNPADPYSYQVSKATQKISGADTDIYFPAQKNSTPYPVLLLLHGFQGNKDQLAQVSNHLASWGMFVVVPNLSFNLLSSDTSSQLQLAVNILNNIETESANQNSVFSNADKNKIGLAGHSAGGNIALQVASSDPRIKAFVGLDAVIFGGPPWDTKQFWFPDKNGSSITAPTLLMQAPSQSCNADGNKGVDIYDYLGSKNKAKIDIRNASHCDFMDANAGCDIFCGSANDARRTIVKKYLTAWFGYFLLNHTYLYDYLFVTQSQSDIQANLIGMEFEVDKPAVVLTPTPSPIQQKKSGDANNDNIVDGLDYVLWLNHYGKPTEKRESDGDFNFDGTVDGLDYVIWLNNYGR